MSNTADRTTPPTLAAPPSLHPPIAKELKLSNGVRVLFARHPGLPLVDVQLILRVTVAADQADTAGCMSLTVDMLDEGAGARTAVEIAEALEDLGASFSASASWDDIAFSMHAHVDRIAPALDILADVVMRPTLADEEFQRRKQQRMAFLLQQNEEPRNLASQAFTSIVFGEQHPYGRPMLGTRATVAGITRDDVAAFHSNYIRPDVAFFVVVGDIDEESVRVMLERAFGGWRADASAKIPAIQTPAANPTRAIHVVDRPGSAQSELRIGGLGIDRTSPDFFPVIVMNTVLGGSFTSRLNLNLRQDKGYTYGAGSSFGLRLYTGPFVASTAVDTNVTADAIHQMMLEIGRMRDEAVPADELARAQNYIALGLPRGFETTSDIANHIAEVELYHLGADYYDGYVDRIRAVTAEEVQRVARKYLDTASFAIVLAGDLAATKQALQALDLGPVLKRAVGD